MNNVQIRGVPFPSMEGRVNAWICSECNIAHVDDIRCPSCEKWSIGPSDRSVNIPIGVVFVNDERPE